MGNTYRITYTFHKSLAGGYKPIVLVNGQPQYFPECNKKTARGALNAAKRIADKIAATWKSASSSNAVTVDPAPKYQQGTA